MKKQNKGSLGITTPVINAVNRSTSVTDPLGNVTTYAYDALDRVITINSPDPDGAGSQVAAVQSNQYDLLGRLTSHLQSMASINDVSTTYTYVPGRVTRWMAP